MVFCGYYGVKFKCFVVNRELAGIVCLWYILSRRGQCMSIMVRKVKLKPGEPDYHGHLRPRPPIPPEPPKAQLPQSNPELPKK